MNNDFLKPYDHNAIEKDLYKKWQESGYFSPENLPVSNPRESSFCIIMPPPNANGSLHVGHAVMVALEDIMIRYARLCGKKTLWLPGADHAGFETQVVFEKKLEKDGTSRFEILKENGGRKKLYQMIWDFTQSNKYHMENQIRQIGASCDWTKETFTLDEKVIKIVYETFKELYDDGLVYRDSRVVNWCVKHQTSLSDLEVAWEDREDKLYYVKYFTLDKKSFITVATTRPETIPGDVAIAVNPNGKWKDWIGKKVIKPIESVSNASNFREISIVSDDAVDESFGTGALKITPAHDAVDFEVGKRHNLQTIKTLNPDGRFNEFAGELQGMKVSEARAKSIEILESKGALEKTETYKHQVGVCYKCKNIVEPMIMPQWFIDLTKKGKEKIVQPAIDAVRSGKIKIVPEFQEKIFFHWMENIRDWNISRQIVWGIQIPVWYCDECLEVTINLEKNPPKKCSKCGCDKLHQETDVFDTWFSSGQWPYATLMTQATNNQLSTINNTDKESGRQSSVVSSMLFNDFYPTSVMETGYDILFFWVARMIMLGLYKTGKVPFKTVYLHGLVRDKDKQKMSKSKGNVVDPLGVVEQYGADALRMALVVGNSPGQDVVYDENKIKGYRNFSNKLWNIARFVLTQTDANSNWQNAELCNEDKQCIEELQKTKNEVGDNIEKYRLSQSAEVAYHYVWHNFADIIIEAEKKILFDENIDENRKNSARKTLYQILVQSLIILHPFMPFVTEAIYQRLPSKNKDFLMVEEW